ncbi:MAG: ASPIC/UnbV domain-containing protein [Planctomycetales bacterium]|nr:ASPIC/UnbV domain-containing protein [Planctomycetales bacterium]
MSQSPREASSTDGADDYVHGWAQLNDLLNHGGSFSGRERNCCFLNLGSTLARADVDDNASQTLPAQFSDISGLSGFDFDDDGRALGLIDWDWDGDLDVWAWNRTAPRLRLLRNNVGQQKHYLMVKLEGVQCNRDAIGARVEIITSGLEARKQIASVKSGGSFLSQSTKWIHFGIGDEELIELRVRWPGAKEFQRIEGVHADGYFKVRQGELKAQRYVQATRQLDDTVPPVEPQKPDSHRMVVIGRLPLLPLDYQAGDKQTQMLNPPDGKIRLISLWASWCRPCLEELAEWNHGWDRMQAVDLDVIALSIDNLDARDDAVPADAIKRIGWQGKWGYADAETLEAIDQTLGTLQSDYRRALSVPTSILLDRHGQVAVVYRGRVSTDRLLQDVQLLGSPMQVVREAATLQGTWLYPPLRVHPQLMAAELKNAGRVDVALAYVEHILKLASLELDDDYQQPHETLGELAFAAGSMLLEKRMMQQAVVANQIATSYLPRDFRPWANSAAAKIDMQQWEAAVGDLNRAIELAPERAHLYTNRSICWGRLGKTQAAVDDLRKALELDSHDQRALENLPGLLLVSGEEKEAIEAYRQLLRAEPQSREALGALSWLLSTSVDESLRDGPAALQMAKRWVDQAPQDMKAHNALAAALAETGDFGGAGRAITRALELAADAGNQAAVRVFLDRKERYGRGEPYRRTPENSTTEN